MGSGIQAQEEFIAGLIVFGGSVVTGFLSEPFRESFFGFGEHEGIGIYDDGGIILCGHFIDEEVVVAAGHVVDSGEAFIAEEDVFFVREVSADAHIGPACQGVGKILEGGMKGIEANDLVEEAGAFFVGTVTQDDFDPVAVTVLHFLHPEFAGRHAIGVGKQYYLVQGFFDAHAQGVFFSGDADGLVFEVDDMEAFEGLFEFVEEEAGVVLTVVVDDDDFVGTGVGLYEGAGQVGDQPGCLIAGADDDTYGVLLGVFFWQGGIEGQPSEEPTIVKQLN